MSEALQFLGMPRESEDDFNLTLIRRQGSLLLGQKTRGYGAGLLVAPGGKTRYYVSPSGIGLLPSGMEAAREASEESGLPIAADQLTQVGALHIADEDDTKIIRLFQVAVEADTSLVSTEFDAIDWYPEVDLPYEQMPKDYKLWLPSVLAGYAVTGFFETSNDVLVQARVFRSGIDGKTRAQEVDIPSLP